MGKLLAAVAGLLGFAWLRKRAERPATEDPAADLRAKLAEARVAADGREEDEAGETPIDEAPDPGDVDERRRSVHERARAAADELAPGE